MLSVVTITRNNFDDLVATVDSVARQRDIELVVVNGGTCERTLAFLASYKPPMRSFKLVSESDAGISDAFNKGIRLATGSAIVFLNSGDTLVSDTYFARAMQHLADHPDIGFVHAAIVFGDQVAGDIVLRPSLSSLGRGMPYRHQTMIVRREIFDTLGLFDLSLKLTMDYDFVCRMHKTGVRGFYDRTEPVIRMDGTGVSSTKELAAYAEVFRVLKAHDLLTPANLHGTGVRYGTYFVRKTMQRLGLERLLIALKKRKHHA